jgi:pimeloyl-ACP methyl ester carboxylesterase
MNVRIASWSSPDSARAHLRAVRCPVVVIHGERDPIIPRRSSLARGFVEGPRREIILVPTMGHAFDPVSTSQICEATSRLASHDVEDVRRAVSP